jgi:FkbM family methyltransferase
LNSAAAERYNFTGLPGANFTSMITDVTSYINSLEIDPDLKRRVAMTAGCRDCDLIPKVAGAGQVFADGELSYQLMHNGVKVIEDGYCGKWMTELIKLLDGHHEPQEEKLFHEVLKHIPPGATMIELGSYWAYYSLWFAREILNAKTFLIEPDPNNLHLGQRNFELNSASGEFFQYSVGREALPPQGFICESDQQERPIAEISVDAFVAANEIQFVDLLLADIQGQELPMLEGARETIREKRLRFVFVSTHHHVISGDPLTHQRCRDFVREHGGHILAEHNVTESFSGDGLIVASFDEGDRRLPPVEITKNHATNSLFRELEYDLFEAQQLRLPLAKWLAEKVRP